MNFLNFIIQLPLRFIVNFNEEAIKNGSIYIQRGGYKEDFPYNETTTTMPMVNNIVQVKHKDVELGR